MSKAYCTFKTTIVGVTQPAGYDLAIALYDKSVEPNTQFCPLINVGTITTLNPASLMSYIVLPSTQYDVDYDTFYALW